MRSAISRCQVDTRNCPSECSTLCSKEKEDEKEIPLHVMSDMGSGMKKEFVEIEKKKEEEGQIEQRGKKEEKKKLTIYSQQFKVKYPKKSQDRFGC